MDTGRTGMISTQHCHDFELTSSATSPGAKLLAFLCASNTCLLRNCICVIYGKQQTASMGPFSDVGCAVKLSFFMYDICIMIKDDSAL